MYFPKLMTDTKTQIQKSQRITHIINIQKWTPAEKMETKRKS